MDYEKMLGMLNRLLAKEDPKKKAARLEKIAVLKRQREVERWEINQSWNVVFGTIKPKDKKEICVIRDITYRNIWMEEK